MIEREDIDRLKEIFVTRQECDSANDEINKKLNHDSTELAIIKQQLSSVIWIGKTTLATVLTAIVGAVLALILK